MRRRPLAFAILASCIAIASFGAGCRPKPPVARQPSIATGAPVIVTMPSGRTDVFVLGSDGSVWQSICLKDCGKHSSFTDWSRQPGKPPGGATSDPGAVAWSDGRIDLFIRGAEGGIWHQTWSDGAWLGWEDLDGRVTSSPIATSWSAGNLHIFALAGDGRLWHRACVAADTLPHCRGTDWMPWLPDPQGPPVAPVSAGHAVSTAFNAIDIAVRGADGALWFQRWAQSYWIGWRSLGGQLGSSPTLVPNGGRLEVYALDPAGGLIRAFLDSPEAPLAWSPANARLGGEPHGAPLVAAGRALLVSKPARSYAFDAVTCAPGAECSAMP